MAPAVLIMMVFDSSGTSSSSTILEMPKARRAMFPAAPVWKAHWCARSVSRVSSWSCLEVGTARGPARWFLAPHSEAKFGSSGGTDGQPRSEKPSTLVMSAYVEIGALSLAGSEKGVAQQLMAAGKHGQTGSGQRICVYPKIPAKSSASGGAGSGTASPLQTAAAEMMMAGSSWSSAVTAGREELEATGAGGPAEQGLSTSVLYRREKGLWQPASSYSSRGSSTSVLYRREKGLWQPASSYSSRGSSTSVLYRRERGLWQPASSYSSLSMTSSSR
nr:uncharacterized protein LOC129156300 [Nothobranchius furzeri]